MTELLDLLQPDEIIESAEDDYDMEDYTPSSDTDLRGDVYEC